MRLLAIDPGANCGMAYFEGGKLQELWTTCDPIKAVKEEIEDDLFGVKALALEDSTLISHIYTAPKLSPQAKLKVARNIGEVDYICKAIKREWRDKPLYSISPKEKGRKLNAEEFNQLTGWTGKSNQHERDAAMVGWKFRNMKL